MGKPISPEEKILQWAKTVAIVGLSADRKKPSYGVAQYLKRNGYRIIPVNPREGEILGEKSYASLAEITEPVDVVDIFRRSEKVAGVVEDAISIGAKSVWMQEEVVNEQAATAAEKAGLKVVMDKCMKKEHQRMCGEEPLPPGVCELVRDDEFET